MTKKARKNPKDKNYLKDFNFIIKNIRRNTKNLVDSGDICFTDGNFINALRFYNKASNYINERNAIITGLYQELESRYKFKKLKGRISKIITQFEKKYSIYKNLYNHVNSRIKTIRNKIQEDWKGSITSEIRNIDLLNEKGDYLSAVSKTMDILRDIRHGNYSYLINPAIVQELRNRLPKNRYNLYIHHCDQGDDYQKNKEYEMAIEEFQEAKELAKQIYDGETRVQLIKVFLFLIVTCEKCMKEQEAEKHISNATLLLYKHKSNEALSELVKARQIIEEIPIRYRNKQILHRISYKIDQIEI